MRILFFALLMLPALVSIAQSGSYAKDLAALNAIIRKTPSFKTQIKGEKLTSYNALYTRLASDSVKNLKGYSYFYNLSQLIFPIRDNHLGFYELPDYRNYRSKQAIDSFVLTKEFLDYPRMELDLDSLRIILSAKPADSVEGIYHYDKYYRVGVFRIKANELVGLILDSDIDLWLKGQVAIHLYESAPNVFKAIYGHPLYKNFILQQNEKYRNQSLINSNFYGSYSRLSYSKQLKKTDYVNLPESADMFKLEYIQKNVQYLLLQTFQANPETSKRSQRFYDSIKNSLQGSVLILDLRNNAGGAKKEMKRYYSLLRNYIRKGQLYVLINNGTLSQAEIFTLKLKKLKNVTTVGQTTRGALSYGSNYGRRVRLPGGRIEIYPTDMNDNFGLLKYEDRGIDPDLILDEKSNWIEQVIRIAKTEKLLETSPKKR